MWLLLVTVTASAVFVDAGYEYNAPNTYNKPLALPSGLQPQRIKIAQNVREEDKASSYSISHKDDVYLRNGNVKNSVPKVNQFNHNYNNPQVYGNLYQGGNYADLSVPFLESNGVVHLNNGSTENTNLLVFKNNSNKKYESFLALTTPDNVQKTWTPVINIPNNIGFVQTSTLPANIVSSGYQSSNTLPIRINSPTTDHNSNNIQHSVIGLNVNHNNVHPHTTAASATFSNLNNGNIYTLTGTGSNNNDNIGLNAIQTRNPMNNGISQTGQDSSGVHLDWGYDNYAPSRSLNTNNGYAQSASPGDKNLNSGYVQSFSSNSITSNQHVNRNNLQSKLISNPTTTFNNLQVTPIIHKHIYFHVPPPEIEEPQNLAPPSPVLKKDYNILFIKTPPYSSQSNLIEQNISRAAVEEKTLIYVFIRKPNDPGPTVLTPESRSQHQVFFVKYNGEPLDNESQVSDDFESTGSVKNIVPLTT